MVKGCIVILVTAIYTCILWACFTTDAVAQTAKAVNILSISQPSGSSRTIAFPVDSSMSQVTVDASYPVAGSFTLTLSRPDGSVVLPSDLGVKFISTETGLYVSVSSPPQGDWSVSLSGVGAFSMVVSGMATLDLLACEFVREDGRPGHEGLFALPGYPVANRPNIVHASMTPGANTAQFDLRSLSGTVLQAMSLSKGGELGSNQFFGQVNPPTSPFMCYVTGSNALGQPYQRMTPRISTGQTVIVESPPPQDLVPGLSPTFRFKVTNLGTSETFAVSGFDSKGYLQSVTPSVVVIGQNESVSLDVLLAIPVGTLIGTSDSITVNVVGAGGGKNFASVRSSVFVKPTIMVPDVVGLSRSLAFNALTEQQLIPGPISEVIASGAAGTVLSQNPSSGAVVPTGTLVAMTVSAGALSVVGDLDNDGDVDKKDIDIILAAKGTAATGPNDPRDIDKDGKITILDARKLATMCTRLNCATQ